MRENLIEFSFLLYSNLSHKLTREFIQDSSHPSIKPVYCFSFFLVVSSFTDTGSPNLLTTLNIPFVAVRTPSDDSNRSSYNSSPSRHLSSSSDSRPPRSLSNTRMSVRETVKSLFRSSKTVDNMFSANSKGNRRSAESAVNNRNDSKLKSSSPLMNNQLSHSQPIVTEGLNNDNNMSFESPLISHSEQTPLIDRRTQSKRHSQTRISFETNNEEHIRLNRHGLHLPLETDGLHRSRSCTDEIILPLTNQEADLLTGRTTAPAVTTNLQPNQSDIGSLHSTDSTASSLSAYLSTQPQTTTQLSTQLQIIENGKNASQESLFSCSSPIQKQRSFKSLIISATSKDTVTKQGNEVLHLIANWVLRSPEDFQGKSLGLKTSISTGCSSRLSCTKRIAKFLCSTRILTSFISWLDQSNQRYSCSSSKSHSLLPLKTVITL